MPGSWSNDAITTLVIPTRATTGARLVIDGTTGSILIYNSANVLVGQLDPTGLWIYDADGSYVHIFDENPGDGAVAQFRPPSSVGTINAPAQIGVATDPITGGIGTSFIGATINGNSPPGVYMNSQGLFLDAPAATGGGLMVAYADAGVVIQTGPNGDVELQDQAGTTRISVSGTTGAVTVNAPITYQTRYLGNFFSSNNEIGPAVVNSTTSASFANVFGAGGVFAFSCNGTKQAGAATSNLLCTVSTSCFSSAINTAVEWEVRDLNSGANAVITSNFFNVASDHRWMSGTQLITGVPAGAYNIAPRWRRSAGAGTLQRQSDDRLTLLVQEIHV